jgi:hypothetical protein
MFFSVMPKEQMNIKQKFSHIEIELKRVEKTMYSVISSYYICTVDPIHLDCTGTVDTV